MKKVTSEYVKLLCKTQLSSSKYGSLPIRNAQRQAIVEKFERMQNVGEDMSQKDLAEWAFKELQLTTLLSQLTISRLRKKRSHAHYERVVNPNRKRKSEGMHPEN